MEIFNKNIIWLDMFPFLTYAKRVKLLSIFSINKDIASAIETANLDGILTEQEKLKMVAMSAPDKFDAYLLKMQNNNILPITIHDARYPAILKDIKDPPLCLYCRGNLQLLNTPCVAVVGTRKLTDYGVVVTKQYVENLCKADFTIVSGLAAGVDSIAHRTALENEGKTIAVLAGGLNHIYPASNYNLAKTISENNLILSELAPEINPQAYQFPLRNRIIAGLSKAVLITEAGAKSGALHTKEYALDYGRDIFAVPGKITSETSAGTNQIIFDYPTSITLNPDDMLSRLGVDNKKIQKTAGVQLDFNQQLVLNYIHAEKKTFQQICEYTKIPASELNGMLLQMELEGIITKLANNSYIKS